MSSELRIVGRFGLWCGIGSMIEFVTLFFIWPAFLPKNSSHSWVAPERSAWLKRLGRFVLPISITLIVLILQLISPLGLFRITFDDNPAETFAANHPVTQNYEFMREKLGWETMAYILYPWKERETVEGLIPEFEKLANVKKVISYKRVEAFETQAMSTANADFLKRELRYSPFANPFISEGGYERLYIYFKKSQLKYLGPAIDQIQSLCRGHCQATGEPIVYREFTEKTSKTLFFSLGISLLFSTLMLGGLLWYYKTPHKWAYVISSLWNPAALILVLSVVQIPIHMVNSVFAAVLVGLAGDNTVQFLFDRNNHRGLNGEQVRPTAATSSILVSIVMMGVSSVFLFLTLDTMKVLGLLLIVGFINILFGDLFLLNSLLTWGQHYSKKIELFSSKTPL